MIEVSLSGRFVRIILTKFGVVVLYDGSHEVEVVVPGDYWGQMCGLCGNYNGDTSDDYMTPDGTIVGDWTTFGISWLTHIDTCPGGPEPPPPPPCNDAVRAAAESADNCGLLKDTFGLFAVCHGAVDPETFFNNCVFDMCAWNGDTIGLCQNLEAYAVACLAAGVAPFSWRTAERCPEVCPPNSMYSTCVSSCPATCSTPNSEEHCIFGCGEGCKCNPGFLLSGQECVPEDQCGCTDDKGRYFMLGERWREDGQNCVCSAGNVITCFGMAVCRAWGDPHYYPFDGSEHHFQGRCKYTLAKDCGNSSDFSVTTQNRQLPHNPSVSAVREVFVEAHGFVVGVHQGRLVTVDGDPYSLSFSLAGGAIDVSLSGRFVLIILTNYSVEVLYDGSNEVKVVVPGDYWGQMCGLCGNYNGDTSDDYMTPDGTIVGDWTTFGSSWLTHIDTCPGGPEPPPPPPCNDAVRAAAESADNCGLLKDTDSPFAVCHAAVDPETFFNNCVFDMCAWNGDTIGLCQNLEAYVDACRAAGVTPFSWRTAERCPEVCPPNSMYSTCVSSCPATCSNPNTEEYCIYGCGEGCKCNPGFLLSGQECVPEDQCGCTDDEGRYYMLGDVWEDDGEECKCLEGDTIECEDECASDPCQYGATCEDEVNGYTCTCAAGYEGVHCETNIDDCASVTCQNGGTCVDGVDSYACDCVAGYDGDHCENDIDDCASVTCRNGGTCVDGVNSYACDCVAGYDGDHCENDIDDCASVTCQNGGTCVDGVDSYACDCVAGYDGDHCENDIDDCASVTCQNGGTCLDGVDSYACDCVAGYDGDHCENDIDDCASVTCQNGGTCLDGVDSYACDCVAGYDRDHCENDIDDCASVTCQNGGTCLDGVDSYACDCVAGYDGDHCENDIDDCASVTCQNGGTCVDGVDSYACDCVAGYDGDHCENDIDDCASVTCQNGGTCVDGVDSYACDCVAGYDGDHCENDIDDCASVTCQNGGTCVDGVDSYACDCVAGYDGDHCENDIDDCASVTCQNGGTCLDGVDSYACDCVAGYDGDHCENDIDDCASVTCQNGGTCVDGVHSYACDCVAGYDGDHCENDIDDCASVTCQNGGTCVDGVDSYACDCVAGYDGDHCENDIDDCASVTCQNGGTCVDGVDSYACDCVAGYDGDHCENDIDDCASVICQNGGTCVDGVHSYACDCVAGYDGDHCENDIDDCASVTCQNGGTCLDGVDSYACDCVAGYDGDHCENDIDDCASVTCQNGGTCVDGVDSYACDCVAGYDGDHCENDIDDCASVTCQNGGTCVDGVDSYACDCVAGYDGDHCENDIDDCASVTCQNGGTCIDGVDSYTCDCVAGYDGDHCENDIDDCASVTCQNGGTCLDGVDSYTCDCVAGYDGDHCENDIDDCASVTCQNGGTCLDGVDSYTCDCAPGFFGDHCETAGCSGRTDPPEDEKMVIFCSGSGPPYLLGTLCINWCDNAEGFFRQSGDESRTCEAGGTWSGDDLVCVDHYEDPTVACSARTDPPEEELGSMFCSNSGPPYKIGTLCIHSCNETEGFFLKSGDESRTCQVGGTWDGDDLVCADIALDPTVACAARTDPPEEDMGSMYCSNSGPPYPIGTICIHSCNNTGGLFPESGDEHRTCQVGGTWDGDDLICAEHGPNSTVACSDRTDPPEAERGNIMFCDQSGPPYPIGTVCTRSCDEAAGYFLNSGDEMRTCQGGAWGGEPLVCAADCAARTDPPEAERGSVFCDNPGPPYPIGTVCSHSCDNLGGYFISTGDTQRTCQVGGIWGGADLVCYVPPDI
ncbi:neurogenic locus notch homolog protein 1-like [Branchiostoma lanceolatum]|uniref:neurogenic locus notch homolog protein 1-like n=1 Tax=Branchiostoma lanceolatum TaxID=7740 RepID=UPI003452AE95